MPAELGYGRCLELPGNDKLYGKRNVAVAGCVARPDANLPRSFQVHRRRARETKSRNNGKDVTWHKMKNP